MSSRGHGMQLSVTAQDQPAEVRSTDTYRLIVFDSAGTTVLLESVGKEYRLPRVEIPQFTRPAQEVTKLLLGTWGISAVFLFSGVLEQASLSDFFAVL